VQKEKAGAYFHRKNKRRGERGGGGTERRKKKNMYVIKLYLVYIGWGWCANPPQGKRGGEGKEERTRAYYDELVLLSTVADLNMPRREKEREKERKKEVLPVLL